MEGNIEIVFVYVGSKQPGVFILNIRVTCFFPSTFYLRESANRGI